MDDKAVHGSPVAARDFVRGLKAGTPIAVGYVPSAVACGILANSAGLTVMEGLFMSLIVFAGASQFVALNLLTIGASFPEIILATAVLNLRHAMMSSAITRRLPCGLGWLEKAWIGFEITDESFSVAAMRKEEILSSAFLMGLNIVGHCTWVLGTWLGFLGASFLPQKIQESMGIAIYALFIGLLVPGVRKNRQALAVALSAMALSALFKWTPLFASMNVGLKIMCATGFAALLGAWFFPLPVRERNAS